MARRTAREDDCARALWLLGLEPPVSARQLTAAWRERVVLTHPDRHLGDERRAHAATILTSALNDARTVVGEWIGSGRTWPSPRSAVAEAAPGPAQEEPDPAAREPGPANAPIDRRTGLRSGDHVRLWPYDGELATVAGVETDVGDGSVWVRLAGGGAARAERVRLAAYGCPVCGFCAGPAVERPAVRPCPHCLVDLRRLEQRPAEAARVRSAIEARAQTGRIAAVALGDASLVERADARLRWARRLRHAGPDDLHAALLASFGRAFERWSGLAA